MSSPGSLVSFGTSSPARLTRPSPSPAKRFVCTLKFQGETDHATVDAFAAIPGGSLVHLAHNAHELTFVHLGDGAGAGAGTAAALPGESS